MLDRAGVDKVKVSDFDRSRAVAEVEAQLAAHAVARHLELGRAGEAAWAEELPETDLMLPLVQPETAATVSAVVKAISILGIKPDRARAMLPTPCYAPQASWLC